MKNDITSCSMIKHYWYGEYIYICMSSWKFILYHKEDELEKLFNEYSIILLPKHKKIIKKMMQIINDKKVDSSTLYYSFEKSKWSVDKIKSILNYNYFYMRNYIVSFIIIKEIHWVYIHIILNSWSVLFYYKWGELNDIEEKRFIDCLIVKRMEIINKSEWQTLIQEWIDNNLYYMLQDNEELLKKEIEIIIRFMEDVEKKHKEYWLCFEKIKSILKDNPVLWNENIV